MNISDILDVAGAVSAVAMPALLPVIGVVNAMVGDDDEKLPEDATGDMIRAKIDTLPAEQRNEVMLMQIDLEKTKVLSNRDIHLSDNTTAVEKFRILSEGSAQSTRPEIVKAFATDIRVVTYLTLVAVGAMVFMTDGKPDWTSMGGLATVSGALLATQTAVVRRYFDTLNDEYKTAVEGATGQKVATAQSMAKLGNQANTVINRIKGMF